MKQYTPDLIRNVAIVGHGGAGKTMLVEHMLYTAGAIERVGSIESGNTQSDHDPLETKRKISISASITPLEYHGHKINVVDVPGFPDFAGDLNAVAEVVGSFIFVVDAKSDLDVGFDLAWEVAEKHNLAKCIFINKLERDNADYDGLIETLHQRYGRRIVNVQIPLGRQTGFDGVVDLVQMKVYKGKDRGEIIEEIPADLKAEADERHEKMMEAAAEGDDNLSMKFLEGNELTPEEVEFGIMEGTLKGAVVPVLLGSAHSGIGVATLLDRIIGELPSPVYKPMDINGKHYEEDPNGPLIAYCFKTTADPYVGKLNYFRIFSGTLKTDAMVLNSSTGEMEKVHNLYYPHGKSQEVATEIVAGDLCVVAKLANTHTGDTLSQKDHPVTMWKPAFPDPVYRVAIEPATKADEDKLGSAMERLLEEDPTLRYTRDAELHQELLEGLGDIHIDTAIDKLKQRFGVTVKTKEAKVPYRETVRGSAKAQGKFKRQSGGRGQYGDCWLEIDHMPEGSGFEFANKVVGGSIPKNYIPAVEKGVVEAMARGVIAGYPLTDIRVTVYDGSYHEVDSSEAAFKMAGQMALKNAVDKATPTLLEPIMMVEVDVPDETVGDVVGDLNTRRGHLHGMEPCSAGKTRIKAEVPMATMMRYALDLRSLTKGRGMFRSGFAHYSEVPHSEAEALKKHFEANHNHAELH